MSSIFRTGVALVVGVLVGGAAVAGVEATGHAFLKGPALFIIAALGLGIGSLLGTTAALFIGRRRWLAPTIGIVLWGLMLMNVFAFAHPVWFAPTATVLIALGVFAALRLISNSGESL
ncbi:MAG: hypothetical protein AAFO78_04440 [Pseudomonadota bacterium]